MCCQLPGERARPATHAVSSASVPKGTSVQYQASTSTAVRPYLYWGTRKNYEDTHCSKTTIKVVLMWYFRAVPRYRRTTKELTGFLLSLA